jgi:alpha-glucosidase
MQSKFHLFNLFLLITLFSCSVKDHVEVSSPNANVNVLVQLTESGQLAYQVKVQDDLLIAESNLGLIFKEQIAFNKDLVISGVQERSFEESWKPVWGPNAQIRNHYNELILVLKNKKHQQLNLHLRVFNDGLGFRYELPAQPGIDSLNLMNELTEFNIAQDGTAWSIPANFESYEMLYKTTAVAEVKDANTPITIKTEKGTYLSIHEANLTNYSGMTLKNTEGTNFQANLVPWPDGTKVKAKESLISPWRTITIANNAGDLVASNLIQNLNNACKIEDTSWIEPMKYIGIWWGMHLGVETWTMGDKHGATTENMKAYIDFAAKHNVDALLAEGWNTGWDKWGQPKAFDQITSYADYDFDEIVAYAKQKAVELIAHHETGGDYLYYEECLEKALQILHDNGIRVLKTGYAGPTSDRHYHHSQKMVQHYRKVVELAAKYQIMLNVHEPIKATGISRTYPNMMTREGARGMEWNAWSEGNPPEHHTILPFTRCLGGPIDYTPGIFDILYKNRKEYTRWNSNDKGNSRVNTTLSKQLALWVCLYSPLQMASDLISNYEEQPAAFRFFEEMPAKFEESKVLAAEIGDYYAVARKNGNNWYIGFITDEHARELELDLGFLDQDKRYKAIVYADTEDTSLQNPTAIQIDEFEVNSKTKLKVKMAAGGGQAIQLIQI